MNLRQIEVFRAVMLAGSVTDAARLLHVSQPGISRMLAHIELQLGLRLFERTKGRLLPTPEAQALYAEVSEVYGGIRRVTERAEELKSGARLSLRVLASPSTALVAVPRAVASLAKEFPAARIYLETLPTREMLSRLTSREADVAISTIPTDNALLTSKPGRTVAPRLRVPQGPCAVVETLAASQRRAERASDLVQPRHAAGPHHCRLVRQQQGGGSVIGRGALRADGLRAGGLRRRRRDRGRPDGARLPQRRTGLPAHRR